MFRFRDWHFISGRAECKMGQMYRARTERNIKLYVANIAMNLWGCTLLKQWNIQINVPPILETNHKLIYVSGTNITSYHKEQSLTIQVVQEQGTTAADISKASTALPLKWLTNKSI